MDPRVFAYQEADTPSSHSPIQNPIDYFSKYITKDIWELMVLMTNIYALQQDVQNFKPTDIFELQTLFGLHIAIRTLKIPRVRMYGNRAVEINLFIKSMTCDRFFLLRSNLHFVNNLEQPTDDEATFYKVWPPYNSILSIVLNYQLNRSCA